MYGIMLLWETAFVPLANNKNVLRTLSWWYSYYKVNSSVTTSLATIRYKVLEEDNFDEFGELQDLPKFSCPSIKVSIL